MYEHNKINYTDVVQQQNYIIKNEFLFDMNDAWLAVEPSMQMCVNLSTLQCWCGQSQVNAPGCYIDIKSASSSIEPAGNIVHVVLLCSLF